MLILGKALGNGYAINALFGKKILFQKLKIHLLVVLLTERPSHSIFKST